MAACIDEYRDRFGVGPICRVPSAALDCGFITPRGYRRFGKRPASRTTARHEAPARDIMQIHPGSFMAVYGYRKMHAQLPAQGWTGIGRDQVARIMREPGIRACATSMGTREPPLQASEQAISRASKHGGTQGLVHHGDHGARYIGTVYTTRVPEHGMLPSTGTVGDSYDNAMDESVNGAYKTEPVWRGKPFRTLGELELATFQWVSWWNTKRLHASLDYKTPQQVENEYYEHQTAQAASL